MKKKKKQEKTIKTNLDIIPIRDYDEHENCFIFSDDSRMDILKIIPRDMRNMSEDEIRREIYMLIKSFKTIGFDIKIISLNFPLNTERQRKILKDHRLKATDEVRRKWIDRQIKELETVDSNIHTSNFYLLYFGKSDGDFKKNREVVEKYLMTGIDKLTEAIPYTQKKQVLIKLLNMNNVYDLHKNDSGEIAND